MSCYIWLFAVERQAKHGSTTNIHSFDCMSVGRFPDHATCRSTIHIRQSKHRCSPGMNRSNYAILFLHIRVGQGPVMLHAGPQYACDLASSWLLTCDPPPFPFEPLLTLFPLLLFPPVGVMFCSFHPVLPFLSVSFPTFPAIPSSPACPSCPYLPLLLLLHFLPFLSFTFLPLIGVMVFPFLLFLPSVPLLPVLLVLHFFLCLSFSSSTCSPFFRPFLLTNLRAWPLLTPFLPLFLLSFLPLVQCKLCLVPRSSKHKTNS